MTSASSHYDQAYANQLATLSEYSARFNVKKFEDFVSEQDTVIDFGCGLGHVLLLLRCARKIGVEINPYAADVAFSHGLEIVQALDDLSQGIADIVISNHALEHVEEPARVIRQIRRVLKDNGLAVIVVPCDRPGFPFRQSDPDMHLYSWSANNIGNLMKICGLYVERVEEIRHRFPPKVSLLRQVFPDGVMEMLCRATGWIDRRRSQVRVVARKR